jgi:transposase InsO family protein
MTLSLAYVVVLPDEKGATAAAFLRRAVAWLQGMGITVERVLFDNGACYRSRLHARACAELGMRHLFTRPYRPRTNGKVCVLASRCRPAGRRGSPRLRV